MKIVLSRLWKERDVVGTIIKNFFILDVTVLLGNPRIYYLEQKGIKISIATVKKHPRGYEIKSVYTMPEYRNKGYVRLLTKRITKDYPKLYLICKRSLAGFYKKLGFKESKSGPMFMLIEKTIANIFIMKNESKIIVMKR